MSEALADLRDDVLFSGTPYCCLGRLGEGRVSTVFLVAHREMHKRFVAKVIHANLVPDTKAVDRFRLEAQSLGQLEHPNIVDVKGTGATSDGRPFIILEHLKGHTLAEELAGGSLDVAEATSYTSQVLAALGAAHAAGILHRDLRPSNVFITRDVDDSALVKVFDFGLAKILPGAPMGAPAPIADATTAGTALGEAEWTSPEQLEGAAVDERGDLYAAARILSDCLAATSPPGPGKALRAVVRKGLEDDPGRRFSSAAEFRAELLRCPTVPEEPETSHAPSRRRNGAFLFVLVMLATVAFAAIVQFVLAGE